MVHPNAAHPTGDTATRHEAFRHSVLPAGAVTHPLPPWQPQLGGSKSFDSQA